MKTLGYRWFLSLFFLMSGGIALYGQGVEAEVPGDNFSLEGALELFKKSASPQEFEQLLNSPDSKVNNLDLNGDGYVDYIRVIDRNKGNVHAFILQAVISETESQDVAVIELEKLANGKAVLQITGDEDIYGVETIIEPTQEVRTYAGATSTRTVVNVWFWPSVQYIYGPYYAVWVSPWRWSYRPVWWHTWRPVAYYIYDPWWHPYRPYYRVCYTHRIAYARHLYGPYRTTSVVVYNRHHDRIAHYRETRHDYDRNGRTRYDGGRSGGYQQNGSTRQDANGRQRSGSLKQGQERNFRPTTGSRSLRQVDENFNKRSSANWGEYSSSNRAASNLRSVPKASQPNTSGMQRDSFSGARSGNLNNNDSRQPVSRDLNRSSSAGGGYSTPNRSSSEHKSVPVIPQRNNSLNRENISRMRSGSGSSAGTRQQMSRPAPSMNRSGASGSGRSGVQRSPTRGSGKSSVEQKRGRH